MDLHNFIEGYLKDFSWVAAGMGAAMIVDFVFYILAGRLMSPVEFGYFGVVTSLYYVFLRSPFQSLEIVSKKLQAEGLDSMDLMGKNSVVMGVVVFLIFAVFSEAISVLIQVPQRVILVFSAVFPLGYLTAVAVGSVQGDENYRLYGFYEFISSFAAFFALFLVYIGFGASGAISMFILELLVGFAVLGFARNISIGKKKFSDYPLLLRSLMFVFAVHAAFSLDLMAVNYFFSTEIAGIYNTVAVFGKGLFFGAVAVNRSVFPKFVLEERDRYRNLLFSHLLLVLGGAAASLFFHYFGRLFISLTFGTAYAGAAVFAPFYMIMITVISSFALVANYCISTDSGSMKAAGVLPLLQLVLLGFFHSSVIQIMAVTAVSALTSLLMMLYTLHQD